MVSFWLPVETIYPQPQKKRATHMARSFCKATRSRQRGFEARSFASAKRSWRQLCVRKLKRLDPQNGGLPSNQPPKIGFPKKGNDKTCVLIAFSGAFSKPSVFFVPSIRIHGKLRHPIKITPDMYGTPGFPSEKIEPSRAPSRP